MSETKQVGENDEHINLLLATKLTAPLLQPDLVVRPRLLSRMQSGCQRRLLLVTAPAGYGKTTLLSTWLATCEWLVAWVALEECDNDPLRFWNYVLAAFDTSGININSIKQLLPLLSDQQRPLMDFFLATLINLLMEKQEQILLVFDDYHLITTDSIHTAIQFLIEHLPPHVHVIIAGRKELPLSLARLRARGEVIDVSLRDLCFTAEEATTFFTQKMKLDLSAQQIDRLRERTEGWAAGLQLAALSLQQWDDPTDFIASFSAYDRYIFDYFTEEVLRGQPATVQDFLLQTSILERLNGSLCDAVTEQSEGEEMLMTLERANLFTLAIDPQRHWYRYHQLFADLLRRLLQQRDPERVALLYRRAALWYERNGQGDEAINYALASNDVEMAVRLIETFTTGTGWYGGAVTRRAWLAALPSEVVRSRPRLSILYALACMEQNLFAAAEPALRDAETTYISADESEQQILLGEIAAIRSTVAINLGKSAEAIEPAQRALQLLPRDDKRFLAIVGQVMLNLADMCLDDASKAQTLYEEAIALNRAAGNLATTITAMSGLGGIYTQRGNLQEAEQTLLAALTLGSENLLAWPSTGKAHINLGAVYYEWNRLDEAIRHVREGVQQCQRWGHIYHLGEGLLLQAQVQTAQRDLDAGFATLEDGKRLVNEATLGASRPISIPRLHELSDRFVARRIDFLLARGDLAGAMHYVDQCELDVTTSSSRIPSENDATLIRLLLAQGKFDAVRSLLATNASFVSKNESEGWIDSTIKALTIQVMVLAASDAPEQALPSLEQALKLAKLGRYIRTFLDAGSSMQRLLTQVIERGTANIDYVTLLLNAFKLSQSEVTLAGPALTDPLSERELAVLRLMAAGLSSSEVASHLIVGVSTVRTHIKHIYQKLDVHSSAEAIERARILKLI